MFVFALIGILIAQGNALINGDPAGTDPQLDRATAYQMVLECTQKVLDNRRVDCQREIDYYNVVSAKELVSTNVDDHKL